MADIELTDFGFTWNAAEVVRLADFNGTVCIEVRSTAGKSVTVYVSPKGKSVRVFRGNHGELK